MKPLVVLFLFWLQAGHQWIFVGCGRTLISWTWTLYILQIVQSQFGIERNPRYGSVPIHPPSQFSHSRYSLIMSLYSPYFTIPGIKYKVSWIPYLPNPFLIFSSTLPRAVWSVFHHGVFRFDRWCFIHNPTQPSRGEAGKREAKARPILFHNCGITSFWKETHILISFCTDAKHITASNELGIKVFLWTLVSFQSLFEPIYTRPKVTSNVVVMFVFMFVHVLNWKIFKTLGLHWCWLALTSCHSLFTSCASLPQVSLPHTHPHA